MDKFPLYIYANPILQFIALILGLYLASTALPKMDSMNFPVRPHERYGRLFLIVVLVEAVVGKVTYALLPTGTLSIPAQSFLSVATVALVVTGGIFGFEGGRQRLRVKTAMMSIHPWLLVIAVVMILAQTFLTIGTKGLGLIKI